MSELRRRLMGGGRPINWNSPWIRITGPVNITDINLDKINRLWNMKTGKEYTDKADGFGWYIEDSSYPVYVGIEWKEAAVYDVDRLFESQDNLVEVSSFLFRPIIGDLFSFKRTFRSTSLLTIPTDLFQGLTRASNEFEETFNWCSGLTGHTPLVDGQKLWERFPSSDGMLCFGNCKRLVDYNEIPDDWK